MGIFHEGWREKDKMTVRTNPTGEGKADKEAAMESPLTGEGEAGGAAMVSPRTGQGGTGQGQPAAGVGESSLLKAATEQRARAQRDIYDIDSRFMGSPEEIDNLHPYRETDEGQKRMAEATARKQEAEAVINELTNPAPVDNHKYLADWSSDSFYNIVKGNAGKHIPLHQAISDYNYWAQKHDGEQLDMYQLYPMLLNKDISKSFEQNEEDEQTRKRKERWQQIGNILSHMANLYGTIDYAPSQNIEDGRQLTERQRRLWDAERSERNKNVAAWLNMWRQAQLDKAKERANEANINLMKTKNNYFLSKKDNDAAVAEAERSKKEAEARRAGKQADLYGAKTNETNTLTPEKVKTERSKQNANGARAKASNSTAYKNYQKGSGKSDDDYIAEANWYLEGNGGPEAQMDARRVLNENVTRTGKKGTKQMNKNVAKDVVKAVEASKQYRERQKKNSTSGKKTGYNRNSNTSPKKTRPY